MAWLTREEAIGRLGVRPQTLYAYVSRGRIEARPDPANPRRSLYRTEDVAALDARRRAPRKASEIAADAIAWGEPVMASALTTVARGRLFYRGRDAIGLSERATLEEAAALFWDAPYEAEPIDAAPADGDIKARLFRVLSDAAAHGQGTRGRAHAAMAEEAASLLELLANAASGASGRGPIHERLAKAWKIDARGADIIRRALVLLLDHELNPSTFAARVSASTGASLAACALTGLCTLSGPLHGAQVYSVVKFAREAERIGARAAVRARLDEGRGLPGFGHNLYPEGDPRAAALLGAMRTPDSIAALCDAVRDEAELEANVDLAVAALAVTLDLPADAPFAIFAVGRAVGWLGHAMEQAETGALIRPRARYVGAAPETLPER